MCKTALVKRLLGSLLVCLMAFGLISVEAAIASPSRAFGLSSMVLADTPAQPVKDLMTQLEMEILPQIENIFSPQQQERFKASIADGLSFRKAFKSLMLTPEQKTQLKTVLSTASKKDALASLTPEQKKQLFLKKKDMFMPTAEEVTDKIEASFKDKGLELPAGVKEKIDAGLKRKDSFMPSAEEITEKIEAGMSALKDQLKE